MKADACSIFVFIDALGWRLLDRWKFLEDTLPHRRPLGTVFGYSSTCHPTILTGKLPRDHQHFSFYYYDASRSPFRLYRGLQVLPGTVVNRGRVRHWLSRSVAWLHGYQGYFQLYNMPFGHLGLFNYSEKRDIYQRNGILGGCPTIFDWLREQNIPFSLPDWRLTDAERFKAMESDLCMGLPALAYLILGKLDGVLHAYGTSSEQVGACLREYEGQIDHLLKAAQKAYDEVRLFVFSDHGMADVRATCNLMPKIDSLGLKFGRDYAAVYDSTMARFWFFNENARTLIQGALETVPDGRILSDDQLHAWGCDFPGRMYGELIFLLEPGVLLCPSFMGARPLAAMHGYAPDDVDSTASFLSTQPVQNPPVRLDDLCGLMRSEVEHLC